MIQQTSLLAFEEAKKHMNNKQLQIYQLMAKLEGKAICNQMLAAILERPINQITPRVLELRQKGAVVEAYRDIYPPTGRKVIYWRVK